MEACGIAIRRPPCGDFLFAQKLWPRDFFQHRKVLNLAQSDKANRQFRKKVNFEIEVADRIFCIQWSI
jgi:hypothetical protein